MAFRRRSRVLDRDGIAGKLEDVFVQPPDDTPLARIRLAGDSYVVVPFEVLQHHEHGGYAIPLRWQELPVRAPDGSLSIPIIEEHVTTTVRPAPERKLRARRRVVTESRIVEAPYMHEHFHVERVPVGQFVDTAPAPRRDGDLLIVPCVEEVVVVEKRLRVREELHIRIDREQRVHRETVTVRRHELDVDAPEEPAPHNGNRKGDSA